MTTLYIGLAVIAIFILYKLLLSKGSKSITTTELKTMLKDKNQNPIYIDVRTPGEFKSNKIKGFKNMPLNNLSTSMNQLPKDRQIVIICQSGARSSAAYRQLSSAGFTDLVNVRGGMSQWRG